MCRMAVDFAEETRGRLPAKEIELGVLMGISWLFIGWWSLLVR
jgi:hypothetical protein